MSTNAVEVRHGFWKGEELLHLFNDFVKVQGLDDPKYIDTLKGKTVDPDDRDEIKANIASIISAIMENVEDDDEKSITIRNTARLFLFTIMGREDDEDSFEPLDKII